MTREELLKMSKRTLKTDWPNWERTHRHFPARS